MKKIFNLTLMTLLMLGLGTVVTSCSDDDNKNKKSEEQKQQEAKQEADVFWDVVSQLVGASAITDDYKDKTFEPTIGEPTELNPLTRVVYTNGPAAAATSYANLVNATGIDENTDSHSWSDPNVGTLSYRKLTDNTAWAEVTVDIKQVPHLQKISRSHAG